MVAEAAIRRRFRLIERHLDERLRRLVAAAEVAAAGAGGVSAVARATGVSRRAIRAGAKELKARGAAALAPGRVRRPVGGRKRTIDQDPTLVADLEKLIEPTTRGDPQSPLRWTCKSVRRLAAELTREGHRTSHRMVAALLQQLGYSLQANRKTIEGTRHPDRNAQFAHINARVRAYPRARRLLITADAGGSNGARVRLWKVELQKLADHLRRPISVCHFPPGTSKWNKIEHRLFSFISQNWRGQPLISHAVIVNLIAATTTPTGLRVRARLDRTRYPSGLTVSRDALDAVRLRPDSFHREWNYTILPTP